MLHHINFPAVSRRPLMYPTGNQLWTQTLIGRSPNPVVSNWLFDQELWVLPNTPLSIDRTILVIFVTSQGLVSFRNVSRRNIVKIIYEEYLPHERLGPCEETFVTDRSLFRNLRIEVDKIVTIQVAHSNTERIVEFERTR